MIQARNGREMVVRLEDGENLMERLIGLGLDSAVIVAGIGMVRDAELGYWNGSEYEIHQVSDACELLAMQGNIGLRDSERIVHAHLTLARRDGSVTGGHLVAATVANTAEIAILLSEGIALRRRLESNGLVGLYPEQAG